jgi:hypothetical protein
MQTPLSQKALFLLAVSRPRILSMAATFRIGKNPLLIHDHILS